MMYVYVIVAILVILLSYFAINYYSATKGTITANLDSFFTGKSLGMDSQEALDFMVRTRYALFKKRQNEFMPLYVQLLSFLEATRDYDTNFTNDLKQSSGRGDFHGIFYLLEMVQLANRLHYQRSPEESLGESESEELKTLEFVVSLMHLCESGAIHKTLGSTGFPTTDFLYNFIRNIDREYYKRLTKSR